MRTAISNANVRRPQGALEDATHRWQVATNDELKTAAEYQPLIVHYNNGAAVRLGDVANVTDSVQDVRNAGMTNAKPAILLMIRKLPEANIIETVDSIRARCRSCSAPSRPLSICKSPRTVRRPSEPRWRKWSKRW
ncbi:multidrug transporter MdtC [Klebsiella michiganensis]|nr:multidrug transporter MdtC [Klebsiella michiganensis]